MRTRKQRLTTTNAPTAKKAMTDAQKKALAWIAKRNVDRPGDGFDYREFAKAMVPKFADDVDMSGKVARWGGAYIGKLKKRGLVYEHNNRIYLTKNQR